MWTRHNFFGPGPSDYTQRPIDADDRIAMEHDLLYERARSFDDIHVSDAKAIKQFGKDFITTGNWHSLVGFAGIGSKYVVEGILHKNIYPNLQRQINSEKTVNHSTKAIIGGVIKSTTDKHKDVHKKRKDVEGKDALNEFKKVGKKNRKRDRHANQQQENHILKNSYRRNNQVIKKLKK